MRADAPIEADSPVMVFRLPLHTIEPDPEQPRRHFEEADLRELADSIRTLGVLQPIVVRPKLVDGKPVMTPMAPGSSTHNQQMLLVAGERRLRASKLAGLSHVPSIIRTDLSVTDIVVLQLVENLQRENLTLPELVDGCARLVDQVGLAEAAKRLGKSKSWVSQRATVVRLSAPTQELVRNGHLADVETAHLVDKVAELDAEEGASLRDAILNPDWGGVPTREDVRDQLDRLRRTAERKQQREEEEAREQALRERQRVENAAAQKGLDLAEGDKPAVPPPPKKESNHDREMRLRREAWLALEPELKRLGRQGRKDVLAALDECLGKPAEGFQLSIGQQEYYASRDCPAKATGATYRVELRGDSQHAGLVLDALAPSHEIGIHIRPTIAQLREIEKILCQKLRFTEYLQVKGSALAKAHTSIRAIHKERSQAPSMVPGLKEDIDGPESFALFLMVCTEPDGHGKVRAADLRAAYDAYCTRHRITPMSVNDNRWPAALEAGGIEQIRRKDGRWCLGIKLLVAAE